MSFSVIYCILSVHIIVSSNSKLRKPKSAIILPPDTLAALMPIYGDHVYKHMLSISATHAVLHMKHV